MRSIKDMYSGTRVILLGLVGILSLLYMFNVYAHRNQHHNDWHVYSNTMNGYMSIINTSNHWHVCTIGVYQFNYHLLDSTNMDR